MLSLTRRGSFISALVALEPNKRKTHTIEINILAVDFIGCLYYFEGYNETEIFIVWLCVLLVNVADYLKFLKNILY